MSESVSRYEVVKGFGEHGSFAELWDRSLAPSGLAFELISGLDGGVTLTGYNVAVPLAEVESFLAEAKTYVL